MMPQQGMWHEKTAEKINNLLRGRGVFLCDYTRINKLLSANEPGNLFFISVRRNIGKRKLTAVCSHQTRIGNLDAHLI
ncbi:hypothetical protein EZ488_00560 [Shigella sonnei]|nr:hypothetical protein [Shigella sonnei]